MTRKARVIVFLLAGTLMGSLVVAVLLPGARDDLMVKLGLLPARRCCGNTKNKHTCIGNLMQIDGIKAIWALENKKSNSDTPTLTDLMRDPNPYLRDEPKCPEGGKYVIGSVAQKPRCSVRGHTL